jgi:transcriptional regulator with XRE-family HTH domain
MRFEGTPPAAVLRHLRGVSRIRQEQAADAAGLSQSQYSRVEGGHQQLTTDRWLRLAPSLVEASATRFLLAWTSEAASTEPLFLRDEHDRLGAFEDGSEACRAAGVLALCGVPRACAIPCSLVVVHNMAFRNRGESRFYPVDEGAPASDPAWALDIRRRSVEYAVSAFASLRREGGPLAALRLDADAA